MATINIVLKFDRFLFILINLSVLGQVIIIHQQQQDQFSLQHLP